MITNLQDAAKAAPAKDPRQKQLNEIARSFETLFVQMLLKTMRSAVHKSGFMDGGTGEQTFTELFDQEIYSPQTAGIIHPRSRARSVSGFGRPVRRS